MSSKILARPSSAKRWIACPASVTLAPPEVYSTNAFTREGTAAHAVCELLLAGKPVPPFITVDGFGVEVDDDMLEHARAYARLVEVIRHDTPFSGVEERVDLDALLREAGVDVPVAGTADFWAWSPITGEVTIVDFKYGRGVVVEAVGNEQGRIYALGVWLRLRDRDVRTIRIVIVQPRGGENPIRFEVLSVEELLQWANETLIPALRRIGAGDTSENAGDGKHCRWCPRSATCSALYGIVCSSAREAFSDAPVAVPSLTGERLGAILDKCDVIEEFIKEARAEALRRLERGETVVGHKLVAKRATRRWRDPELVEAALHEPPFDQLPATAAWTRPALVSPAQLEKVFKEHGLDASAIEAWVSRESSGVTLAREGDRREKVTRSAASLFHDAAE